MHKRLRNCIAVALCMLAYWQPLQAQDTAVVLSVDPYNPGNVVKDQFIVVLKEQSLAALIQREAPSGVGAFSANDRLNFELKRVAQIKKISAEQDALIARLGPATPAQNNQNTKVSRISIVQNALSVSLTEKQRMELEAEGYSVTPVKVLKPVLNVSTSLTRATNVWSLKDDFGKAITGQGVTVGIIDTGVDFTHPDFGSCTQQQFLDGNCIKVRAGKDFVDNDLLPLDPDGHGTHVASIVASKGEYKGMAPDATIYALRVCGEFGCFSDAIMKALDYAADPNADGLTSDHLDVVNLSLGGPGFSDDVLSTAVNNAVKVGIVAAVAAGNSGPSSETIGSPGAAEDAITVAASFKEDISGTVGPIVNPRVDQIAHFSSRGPAFASNGDVINKPDITAPGVFICAAKSSLISVDPEDLCGTGKHMKLSGTSMATPHIAGAAALLVQAYPTWKPSEIKNAMMARSKKLTDPNSGAPYDFYTQGSGRVDIFQAVTQGKSNLIAEIKTRGAIKNEPLSIIGSAGGPAFVSYVLSYKESDQISWVTLATGSTPKTEQELGVLNVPALGYEEFSLKLEVFGTGETLEHYSNVYIKPLAITAPTMESISGFFDRDALSGLTDLEILGTVSSKKFERYAISFCPLLRDSFECADSAIRLENDGLVPVVEGLLGRWRPADSKIPTGFYALRLEKFRTDTVTPQVIYGPPIYVDMNLRRRPVDISWTCGTLGCNTLTDYLITDLNSDGQKEFAFDKNGKLFLIEQNGNLVPGWPKQGETSCIFGPPNPTGSFRKYTTGDVEGDGRPEVVVSDTCGFIHAYRYDGSEVSGFPKNPTVPTSLNYGIYPWFSLTFRNPGQASDSIFFQEISLGSNLESILFNKNGLFSGWPKALITNAEMNALVRGDVARVGAVDLDNNGTSEILVLNYECNLIAEFNYTCVAGTGRVVLTAFSATQELWSKSIPVTEDYLHSIVSPSLVVGNFFNDFSPSIVVRYGPYFKAFTTSGADDIRWTTTPNVSNFAVSDFDNDNKLDFAAIDGCLSVVNRTGEVKAGFPQCVNKEIGLHLDGYLEDTPRIANVEGDATPEILAGGFSSSRLLRWGFGGETVFKYSPNGKRLDTKPIISGGFRHDFQVTDMDSDNLNDVIVFNRDKIFTWATGACSLNREPWPTEYSLQLMAINPLVNNTACIVDHCPANQSKDAPGVCGCSNSDSDTDGDGFLDCGDECPTDSAKIAEGVCGCSESDQDQDFDGAEDCIDGCPSDPSKKGDVDSDGDGTVDCVDKCPSNPDKIEPDQCLCALSNASGDTDGDGTRDCIDLCPNDPLKVVPGQNGCGVPEPDDGELGPNCTNKSFDSDLDGLPDCADGCPTDSKKAEPGSCGCGVEDKDKNSNGVPDCIEETANPNAKPKAPKVKVKKKVVSITLQSVAGATYEAQVRVNNDSTIARKTVFSLNQTLSTNIWTIPKHKKGRFKVRYRILRPGANGGAPQPSVFSRWVKYSVGLSSISK